MIKQSAESIKNNLKNDGVEFKSFVLSSEGQYDFDDADWNYKDIPHLKHVHDLVESLPTFATDEQVNHIIFQKIPPFFRVPMCVTNYDYNKDTQIYYTSFLFFILLIKTKIVTLGKNHTRVDTEYNIGFTNKIFKLFFPILKFLIKRNYENLMLGDIPMRDRRGKLRTDGYDFTKKNPKGKISYTETTELLKPSVIIPNKLKGIHKFKANIDELLIVKNMLLGPDNDAGIRLFYDKGETFIFKRICHHQGACLSQAKITNKKIYCPWHGQALKPLGSIKDNQKSMSNDYINIKVKNKIIEIQHKIS